MRLLMYITNITSIAKVSGIKKKIQQTSEAGLNRKFKDRAKEEQEALLSVNSRNRQRNFQKDSNV